MLPRLLALFLSLFLAFALPVAAQPQDVQAPNYDAWSKQADQAERNQGDFRDFDVLDQMPVGQNTRREQAEHGRRPFLNEGGDRVEMVWNEERQRQCRTQAREAETGEKRGVRHRQKVGIEPGLWQMCRGDSGRRFHWVASRRHCETK